jgi:hypothetical protein
LISFKSTTPEEVKQDVYDRYQRINEECGGKEAGILYWNVSHNLDLRKGVHLVELGVFTDNDALQKFRVHPKHKELTELLCQIADWQVGDFVDQ